jgi:hypothetical protein
MEQLADLISQVRICRLALHQSFLEIAIRLDLHTHWRIRQNTSQKASAPQRKVLKDDCTIVSFFKGLETAKNQGER